MVSFRMALVYFSATNVTQTYAEFIRDELVRQGCATQLFNVTSYASRLAPLSLDGFDGVIFGFPIFVDFAPSVINEWLPQLDGRGMKCALFFTYGGRTTGYAHFHTKLLLEQAHFHVLFSAEFLGRHSFNLGGWKALPERPNSQDFAIARQYAALAKQRLSGDMEAAFKLQKPFGYDLVMASLEDKKETTQRQWINPVRFSEECGMCRDCEVECPTRSFDADTGLSEPRTCIGCMRCVYICPEKAITVEQMRSRYDMFLSNWHLTEEMMRAKKSRIITESWEATF
jgi:ferredoxin